MYFEVHRLSTNLFVAHKIKKMSRKIRWGYFMSRQTGRTKERAE